jgi:hypothetical protein
VLVGRFSLSYFLEIVHKIAEILAGFEELALAGGDVDAARVTAT